MSKKNKEIKYKGYITIKLVGYEEEKILLTYAPTYEKALEYINYIKSLNNEYCYYAIYGIREDNVIVGIQRICSE